MSEALGQPAVVENHPGAGGILAVEAILRAPADGHTLFLAGSDPSWTPSSRAAGGRSIHSPPAAGRAHHAGPLARRGDQRPRRRLRGRPDRPGAVTAGDADPSLLRRWQPLPPGRGPVMPGGRHRSDACALPGQLRGRPRRRSDFLCRPGFATAAAARHRGAPARARGALGCPFSGLPALPTILEAGFQTCNTTSAWCSTQWRTRPWA
jgi:hypothetical protein